MSQSPESSVRDAGADGRAITPAVRLANLLVAATITVVAAAAIWFARGFPGTGTATDFGAARFPMVFSGALIVLSGLLVLDTLRRPLRGPLAVDERPRLVPMLIGLAATAAYIYLISYTGYILTSVVFLIFMMRLMGLRHPFWIVVIALAITFSLYFVFLYGLNIPLPAGSLLEDAGLV